MPTIRVARPVSDLARAKKMYSAGLELELLAEFKDHDGFDGVILGKPGLEYHLEFTICTLHPVKPSPTPEDLVVFFIPEHGEWLVACNRMIEAGFIRVNSLNPYWDVKGQTFQDPDGYRIVVQHAAWNA